MPSLVAQYVCGTLFLWRSFLQVQVWQSSNRMSTNTTPSLQHFFPVPLQGIAYVGVMPWVRVLKNDGRKWYSSLHKWNYSFIQWEDEQSNLCHKTTKCSVQFWGNFVFFLFFSYFKIKTLNILYYKKKEIPSKINLYVNQALSHLFHSTVALRFSFDILIKSIFNMEKFFKNLFTYAFYRETNNK